MAASLLLSPTSTDSFLHHAGYGAWLHGEAVAAGTMMAADMSQRLGWIDAELVQRIRALNEKAKLPVAPPPVSMPVWLLGTLQQACIRSHLCPTGVDERPLSFSRASFRGLGNRR